MSISESEGRNFIKAVSYTHLDVQKRQESSWIIYSYLIDIKKPITYKSSINVETYLEGIKKF